MDALIGLASGGVLTAIKKAMENGGEALKDAIAFAGKHVKKCTNCFVAGTLVATACGLVPIEDVQAGDWVWARDEVTGEVRLCEVEETYRNESPVILEVTAGDETLATTPGHPFWVVDHGWKDAGDLELGDRLVNLRGESVVVEDIRRRPVPEAVYNFSVAGLHTYFVGQGGIWVHNNSGSGCAVPGNAARATPNPSTGVGYGVTDPPVRIQGTWTEADIQAALRGRPPASLGSPDLHHAGQMPGSAIHEIVPGLHQGNKALHPNKYNQGVTGEMRRQDRQLHWWYRAREQGADRLFPGGIYD